MAVVVSSGAAAAIAAHALAVPDEEVCGVLLGNPGNIREAAPGQNIASERMRARTYELDPTTHLHAAESGLLVGYYHSHPVGPSYPSGVDVKGMLRGQLYAIYDCQAGRLTVWLREGRKLEAVRVWPEEGRTLVRA